MYMHFLRDPLAFKNYLSSFTQFMAEFIRRYNIEPKDHWTRTLTQAQEELQPHEVWKVEDSLEKHLGWLTEHYGNVHAPLTKKNQVQPYQQPILAKVLEEAHSTPTRLMMRYWAIDDLDNFHYEDTTWTYTT